MKQQIRIDEQVTVSSQPDPQALAEIAKEGFRTVVNLRTAEEVEQPLTPDEEDRCVNELGMEYVHFPVSPEAISEECISEFRRKLQKWPPPVLVHCRSGKRSGAFVMMDRAVRNGWTGEQTLAKAEKMGFACDVPELKNLVKTYVDNRRS